MLLTPVYSLRSYQALQGLISSICAKLLIIFRTPLAFGRRSGHLLISLPARRATSQAGTRYPMACGHILWRSGS